MNAIRILHKKNEKVTPFFSKGGKTEPEFLVLHTFIGPEISLLVELQLTVDSKNVLIPITL